MIPRVVIDNMVKIYIIMIIVITYAIHSNSYPLFSQLYNENIINLTCYINKPFLYYIN